MGNTLPGQRPSDSLRETPQSGRSLPAAFLRYHAEVNDELRSLVDGQAAGGAAMLYDMMRYHLGWIDAEGRACPEVMGGKALRPTLCLLTCEACCGDYHRALPASAAVELVHNYSLIHDDIQDDDRERRHRPTVWSIWGKAQAINAGTAMRMLANVAVRRLGVPLSKQVRVQSLIDEATIRLLEGQHLDISYENRFDITSDDYFAMAEGKTAALIACALEAGAVLATDDESVISSFRDLGWNLGLAFQARDDILGIWGRQEETGKPLGSDIIRRKKTFPIVYGLEKAKGTARDELVRVYNNGVLEEEAVSAVLGVLEQVGAREESQRVTEHFAARAAKAVGLLPIGPAARQAFLEIISFLADRTF